MMLLLPLPPSPPPKPGLISMTRPPVLSITGELGSAVGTLGGSTLLMIPPLNVDPGSLACSSIILSLPTVDGGGFSAPLWVLTKLSKVRQAGSKSSSSSSSGNNGALSLLRLTWLISAGGCGGRRTSKPPPLDAVTPSISIPAALPPASLAPLPKTALKACLLSSIALLSLSPLASLSSFLIPLLSILASLSWVVLASGENIVSSIDLSTLSSTSPPRLPFPIPSFQPLSSMLNPKAFPTPPPFFACIITALTFSSIVLTFVSTSFFTCAALLGGLGRFKASVTVSFIDSGNLTFFIVKSIPVTLTEKPSGWSRPHSSKSRVAAAMSNELLLKSKSGILCMTLVVWVGGVGGGGGIPSSLGTVDLSEDPSEPPDALNVLSLDFLTMLSAISLSKAC
mmetsp:Transcript_11386/g.23284  ORF Transcript_11386/g.23284 Transcript_11386/m.23284 type:complete len:396 (+) Transcript_11386:636-1823(+)